MAPRFPPSGVGAGEFSGDQSRSEQVISPLALLADPDQKRQRHKHIDRDEGWAPATLAFGRLVFDVYPEFLIGLQSSSVAAGSILALWVSRDRRAVWRQRLAMTRSNGRRGRDGGYRHGRDDRDCQDRRDYRREARRAPAGGGEIAEDRPPRSHWKSLGDHESRGDLSQILSQSGMMALDSRSRPSDVTVALRRSRTAAALPHPVVAAQRNLRRIQIRHARS
eukprot:s573_g5.t1